MQRPGALPLLVVTIQIQNRIESHSQIKVQSQGSKSNQKISKVPNAIPKFKAETQTSNSIQDSESKSKSRIHFKIQSQTILNLKDRIQPQINFIIQSQHPVSKAMLSPNRVWFQMHERRT